MNGRNYAAVCVLGLASGVNLAFGLNQIASRYSIQDSVRKAIYAKAEEITPQVIEKANSAAKDTGFLEGMLGGFNLGVAGVAGAAALKKLREKD